MGCSGRFSLGCLRNRCSRLLQLSDNNWETLVVEERTYRCVGRRTVAVVLAAAAPADADGAMTATASEADAAAAARTADALRRAPYADDDDDDDAAVTVADGDDNDGAAEAMRESPTSQQNRACVSVGRLACRT